MIETMIVYGIVFLAILYVARKALRSWQGKGGCGSCGGCGTASKGETTIGCDCCHSDTNEKSAL